MPGDGWTRGRRRPETATLERPLLLDPAWISKLDMTTVSRESLTAIDNLIVGKGRPQEAQQRPNKHRPRANPKHRFQAQVAQMRRTDQQASPRIPAPPKPAKVPESQSVPDSTAYCYICGKIFDSASSFALKQHEVDCLERWHKANQELPVSQRQPEPIKPEKVLVNVARLDDTFWKEHLTQLVPCPKCGRKFNPDRVIVHEKSCKGPAHK